MRKWLVIILVAVMGLAVVGCQPKAEANLTIEYEYLEEGIVIDEFHLADIQVVVNHPNGDQTKVSAEKTMLSFADYLALKEPGSHEVTFSYEGLTETVTIILLPEVENEAFNLVLDEMFIEMMGEDPLDINFSLYYPENYDLDQFTVEPFAFSEESEAEYFTNYKDMKADLEAFADGDLSSSQLLSKKIIIDYINRQLAFEGFYYYGTNLGSYLGYQAQLPLILAEYRFDDAGDIANYLDYVRYTDENFAELVAFENGKIALEMGLPDEIINRVIVQIEAFLAPEECYLVPLFVEKIADLSFLSASEKEAFALENEAAIEEHLLPGYASLKDDLTAMLGNTTKTGALAEYENGPAYYEAMFREATGSNMSVVQAKAYLTDLLDEMMETYQQNSEYYGGLYDTDLMKGKELADVIPFFMEAIQSDFPALNITLDYQVKEISESLQENSSPAMYFISPIDGNREETIYINPLQFSEANNYMYQTMAHEGYPGHLYQNVFMKNQDIPDVRKILNYSGYAEAWATYVENYVIKYAGLVATSATQRAFELFDSINYVILGLADIGINYEGWSEVEMGEFLREYFMLTDDEIHELFFDLVEVPTNYLQYYFSYYQLKDLKTMFKEQLGMDYSDMLFHTVILETGPAPFHILQEQLENYE